MLDRDLQIATESAFNDGIVSRADLLATGLSSRSIDRRVTKGVLIPVLPGVYRHAGHPNTWRSRVRAAFLWAGEGGLLSGATVLALRGLEGFTESRVEVSLRTSKKHPDVLCRRLAPDEQLPRRPIDGMWATTIERALLDASASYSPIAVGRAMDDALRRRLTSVAKLRAEAEAFRGRGKRGLAAFRRLVQTRDPDDAKVRSEMETRMLRILRRIPSHRFIPDHAVEVDHKRFKFDFAVPEVRLAVECHSQRWHGPSRLNSDMARHRKLTLNGWTILYYTWDDITFRPHEVEAEIRAALASSLPI